MDKKSKQATENAVARIKLYQSIFRSPDGKKVLEDLCMSHHMRTSTFSKDPMEMAMQEGERNVVLRIMAFVDTDDEKLNKLIREQEGDENA